MEHMKNDMVNHPSHYMSETGMEVIDVIEAFTFDLKGGEAYCIGNVLKYICRYKHKNGIEDLKKALANDDSSKYILSGDGASYDVLEARRKADKRANTPDQINPADIFKKFMK